MILELSASHRGGEPLREFLPSALGRAPLAPTLHARAFVKGALTELPERSIACKLPLETTEGHVQLSVHHAHFHIALRLSPLMSAPVWGNSLQRLELGSQDAS